MRQNIYGGTAWVRGFACRLNPTTGLFAIAFSTWYLLQPTSTYSNMVQSAKS